MIVAFTGRSNDISIVFPENLEAFKLAAIENNNLWLIPIIEIAEEYSRESPSAGTTSVSKT